MNLNAKIISLLVIGFFLVSAFLTVSSVLALRTNQAENIRLFKEEFLELGRESFDNTSILFFNNLDSKIKIATSASQNILDTVQQIDPEKTNTFVYSIPKRTYILEPQNAEVAVLLDESTVEKYIQENILNLKNMFELDNFQAFLSDTTGKAFPIKVQVRFYSNLGVIVGYTKVFTTGKVRIEYIQRKNEQLFQAYFISSMVTVCIILVTSILFMIILMQNVVIKPLRKISYGLEQVQLGALNTKIDIRTKDEIGGIANVFNKMTGDLEKSRKALEEYSKTLEQKVEERTGELNSKLEELERMNKLMIGRELKMVQLKEEIEELKKSQSPG
jgi:methyl-accepting chemotaxis protein